MFEYFFLKWDLCKMFLRRDDLLRLDITNNLVHPARVNIKFIPLSFVQDNPSNLF